MKNVTKLLFTFLALMGMLVPHVAMATEADVNQILQNGGIFRLKNRGSNYYATETTAKQLKGQARLSTDRKLSQIWILEKVDTRFTFRNAFSGRYIPAQGGDPMSTVFGPQELFVKYSAANASNKTTSYVTISWDKNFDGNNCMNENNQSHNLLGWKANSPTVNDSYSDWIFEAVTDVTVEDVKAQISASMAAAAPAEGKYFRVMNASYGVYMTSTTGTGNIGCIAKSETDYTQLWQLEKEIANGVPTGKWRVKNALTEQYIQRQNGTLSKLYKTTKSTANSFFLGNGTDSYVSSYTIEETSGTTNVVGLHCDANRNVVGWYTNNPASQWIFQEVEVNMEELQAEKEKLAAYNILTSQNITKIRTTLRNYFVDEACTQLKEEYQTMGDEALVALMSAEPTDPAGPIKIALPRFIQDIVLKVKNNQWGHREKEFRIYDYNLYTIGGYEDGGYRDLIGTSFCFSNQTGPTGISVKKGDVLFIFVDATIKSPATMKVMNCEGMTVEGTKSGNLVRGFNVYTADKDGFIFINYHIANPNYQLANFPPVKVHIQGGRVNGYFDITRGHTNEDWLDMEKTLFQDRVVHMKSKYTQYNMHLDQVKSVMGKQYKNDYAVYPTMYSDMRNKRVDADGVPMGIQGVLQRWDSITYYQYDLMDVKKYEDRFNGMLSASSSAPGNPHASSYGTYYPGVGGTMDYYDITIGRDTDEGGNLWMLAHEVGHIHQRYINMAGCTEISNNFYSQVTAWKQGSHVGRGRPLSKTITHFHNGNNWHEYDLWQRTRFYLQLWLYYHEMGHKPTFFQELFEKLRKTPMTASTNESSPGSGSTDFLRFAKFCCDVAQEDLSEFFEFYGMFRPTQNFKVGDYTNTYFTTTQADINAAKEYMKKFPKKAHPGLIFIDERIRPVPATYPGAKAGQMRWATSGDASPGVVSEVGEVGMHLDFNKNLEVAPYAIARVAGSHITIDKTSGKGAVGFKVYDLNDKLVYVSNTYSFSVPSTILNAGYKVVVAFGNGQQQIVYDSQNPTTAYDLTGEAMLTQIESTKADSQTNDEIYDLSGRRTTRSKGVQIVNGKLVIQ